MLGYLYVIIVDSAGAGLPGYRDFWKRRSSVGEIRFAANTLSYLGNVLQSFKALLSVAAAPPPVISGAESERCVAPTRVAGASALGCNIHHQC
jgi:hypothetical protein